MLIWCSRNISHYYQCWKQFCCLMFCGNWDHFQGKTVVIQQPLRLSHSSQKLLCVIHINEWEEGRVGLARKKKRKILGVPNYGLKDDTSDIDIDSLTMVTGFVEWSLSLPCSVSFSTVAPCSRCIWNFHETCWSGCPPEAQVRWV